MRPRPYLDGIETAALLDCIEVGRHVAHMLNPVEGDYRCIAVARDLLSDDIGAVINLEIQSPRCQPRSRLHNA